MQTLRTITILLFVAGIIAACEKQDDYSRISYNYRYRANFAFAIGSSYMDLSTLGVNLPWGWENNPQLLNIPDSLILEDDLPFEPQSWIEKGGEKIIRLVIRVRGSNEFPDRAQLTFSLADSLKQSVFPDDFLANVAIPEAVFANDTLPAEKGNFETEIILSDKQIQNMSNKRYFHIYATISNQTKHVDFYRYYRYLKIEVRVGVQVQFDFNLQTLKQQ